MAKRPTSNSGTFKKYLSYEHAQRSARHERMLAELDRLGAALARHAAMKARPEFANSGGVVVPLPIWPRIRRGAAPKR